MHGFSRLSPLSQGSTAAVSDAMPSLFRSRGATRSGGSRKRSRPQPRRRRKHGRSSEPNPEPATFRWRAAHSPPLLVEELECLDLRPYGRHDAADRRQVRLLFFEDGEESALAATAILGMLGAKDEFVSGRRVCEQKPDDALGSVEPAPEVVVLARLTREERVGVPETRA